MSNTSSLQQAQTHFDQEQYGDTITLCDEYLQTQPKDVKALVLLARAYMATRKYTKAFQEFEKALEMSPDNAFIHIQMGRILFNGNRPLMGQRSAAKAVVLDRDNPQTKTVFFQMLANMRFRKFEPDIKAALEILLHDPDIRHRPLFAAWFSLLCNDPDFRTLLSLINLCAKGGVIDAEDLKGYEKTLNDPYFCVGLARLIVNDPALERTLIKLRRAFLKMPAHELKNFRPFLAALSAQCFFNQYMFFLTQNDVEELQALMQKADSPDQVLLLSCYLPLHEFENAEEIKEKLKAQKDETLNALVQTQIEEPKIEKELKAQIKSFCSVEDSVSKSVKQQYEESPYPRWSGIPTPVFDEKKEPSAPIDILIAGCGTGQQVLATAINFPNAKITAFDLSYASLSYAQRKVIDLGLSDSITIQQGDILQVEKLNQKFDFISCGGVLHHMENPEQGLAALKEVLKPDGVMKIALYSEIARRHIIKIQQWVKENGYAATPDDIRRFRYDVLFNKREDPILQEAKPLPGMFSISETRDTYFNVQEHQYNCLTLKSLIEGANLDLLDFAVDMPRVRQAYQKMFPEDDDMVNLENWHAFEQSYPNVFLTMYTMILGQNETYTPHHLPKWLNRA